MRISMHIKYSSYLKSRSGKIRRDISMENSEENLASAEQLNLHTIHSRVESISETLRSAKDFSGLRAPESQNLIKECILELQSGIEECLLEFSDLGALGVEELDMYLEDANKELNFIEAETLNTCNEIEILSRSLIEDSSKLESDLEGLNCSLSFIKSQNQGNLKMGKEIARTISTGNPEVLDRTNEENKIKVLELDQQIEDGKGTLSTLQDLFYIFKRFEAIEQIEDILTGLKVLDLEGNCIRLSLKTFLPTMESLLCQQKMEYAIDPTAVDHELVIEVSDETMDLKNVEIFPNDAFIGDIVDSAKSRQFCPSTILEMGSSLEWLVRKVQNQIVSCSLRRLLVKEANKSGHSFEYSDRDEMIVAHIVGGFDAFIKLPQGWPMLTCALKLISLKSSESHSRAISLSFICKVEEMANSLDVQTRQNLLSFADAIKAILVQQMRSEL
ncbi:hypothetical protein Sjap_008955 [Stephania japonica]|uniref:Uncharacterized protein n=1 Tax=Stephania japonica TaxID=461633 RepID=A0AAP0JRA2_9MAGN